MDRTNIKYQISNIKKRMKRIEAYLALVFLADGFLWLKSGLEKVSTTKFLDGLAGTLAKFASNNPFGWYKGILMNIAVPNALLVGVGVEAGEIFAGVMIVVSGLVILSKRKATPLFKVFLRLGFLAAILLSGSFWLAAGWTSASTESLNLLMLALELVGLTYWLREW